MYLRTGTGSRSERERDLTWKRNGFLFQPIRVQEIPLHARRYAQ
jgi:hypothetical protein